MSMLEKAISLAVEAHAGQKDKVGAPYILHPLRLMCRMETDVERMAAVLHDVVEDTGRSLADLSAAGFPGEVVGAVERLTRKESETYEQFIERVLPDAVARRVKIADLEDNMNLLRLPQVNEKDRERLNKYLRAWSTLKAAERR